VSNDRTFANAYQDALQRNLCSAADYLNYRFEVDMIYPALADEKESSFLKKRSKRLLFFRRSEDRGPTLKKWAGIYPWARIFVSS
jgi:hypothetical protein